MEGLILTIGHSNRTAAEFLTLVGAARIETIVDVRTIPRSRAHPHFGREILMTTLADAGIGYVYCAALGGRRARSRVIPPEVNAFWENQSFHNYADYALSPEFGMALNELREIGRPSRCAVMCSEAVWWRCHRRIIADYLIASGVSVLHVLGANRIEPAKLTASARIGPDGRVRYPAA